MQDPFHQRKVVRNTRVGLSLAGLTWLLACVCVGSGSECNLVFNKDEDDSFIPSPFFISNPPISRFLSFLAVVIVVD